MARYCVHCERKVKGTKKFNWAIAILGLLTCDVVTIIYCIWYLLKRNTKCSICGLKTKGWIWQKFNKDKMKEVK